MAVLALRRSSDPLVHVALSQLDVAIHLFTQVLKYRQRPTIASNLAWLLRIRQRIGDRLSIGNSVNNLTSLVGPDPNDNDDTDLVGLQTRLVERAVTTGTTLKPTHIPDTFSGSGAVHTRSARPGTGEGEAETTSTVAFTTPDTTADHFVCLSVSSSRGSQWF